MKKGLAEAHFIMMIVNGHTMKLPDQPESGYDTDELAKKALVQRSIDGDKVFETAGAMFFTVRIYEVR